MDSFVFALNATLPIFLLILLGWFLRRVGILSEGFTTGANKYVFQCALPFSLFRSMSHMDFRAEFDPGFCLFCFGVTTAMFFGIWGLSWLLMKDRALVGAFSQASVRASAAILGVAMAENIYGSAGMVPMMIMASVPFFNAYSVVILTFSPHVDAQGHLLPPAPEENLWKKTLLNVAKNPIIIAILLGIPFSVFSIPIPHIAETLISQVAGTATTIALLVVGASLSGLDVLKQWKPTLAATLIKLFLLPAVFLPLAAFSGFRNSAMIAILIMVGGPTTVSCFVMAKQMGGDAPLTAQVVALSTLVSSVSITFWVFLLRWFSLI